MNDAAPAIRPIDLTGIDAAHPEGETAAHRIGVAAAETAAGVTGVHHLGGSAARALDAASRAIRGLDREQQAGNDDMPAEQRDYGVGAQILAELGVHDMVLLTNTRHSLVGLEGYDLSIVGERPIEPA